MDVEMVKKGLAAMLYFEAPEKVEGKAVPFKDIDEKKREAILKKAGTIISHLDKLEFAVVSKSKMASIKDVGTERIKIIAGAMKKRLSALKRPAQLMDFVNDNVLEEIAIAVNIELIDA